MDILWTPWRLDYILGAKQPGCVLCQKIHENSENDPSNLLLYRGQHSFIVLNLYPYNNGHLMVVPYQHTSDLTALAPEIVQEIFDLTQRCVAMLKAVYRADGFNLGMNLGKVAGAGIDDHLHQHIVPRWNGDTNFMPVLAQTRTMPELLTDSYSNLKTHLDDFFNQPQTNKTSQLD
ncbi:MAG: HIT domain-containing protein [Chloroflexi bacterium]|uniref:HIT domain-containing protein n=1 Tax=Candidatus Chlorohelix allophototropha TaxID=3003348 RepID=A0A8T7LW01_9CHLR|nr:HIT domain-containing protein [Chloroflexota bacterium]WJW66245.1 HIT domain-containing protein [Chloroflexota bacterium L227-S17]